MAVLDIASHAARVGAAVDRVALGVPGLQYAMTDATGVRFERCAGFADVGGRREVKPDTLFMAASCTKVLTAAAVLALVDSGKLALDARLGDHFPDHPYGRDVTIAHLLAHTSGVPNPMPINWLHRIDDASFDEDRALADVMRAHPKLEFAPGARYAYSNVGYWLLGKVIERASGSRYSDFVRDQVLADVSFAIDDPAKLARGYQPMWSALGLFTRVAVRAPLLDGRDGGWLRFARVYMNGPAYGGAFATARAFCGFLRSQIARPPTEALGWRAGTLAGVEYFAKPGGGPGFCGCVRVYPSAGIATAWFANRMEVSEQKILSLGDDLDRGWL